MLSPRVFITVLLTSLVLQATTGTVRADEIADGERDFVKQLQAKQFYDLAEQFCDRQSQNCRTSDDRAAWQLMLADSREQHAWILKEPGRTQLLTHAVQTITDFVRNEPPRAELDLLLRVRQIEILSTIARIDATVAEFGPQVGPSPLAVQAMTEGLQQSQAMLEQIDQIRKEIDSSVAKAARDRTRFVAAELLLFQSRQKPDDADLRTRAAEAAEQLMRASGDDDMRFRARALLAESLLDNNDFKGFDLSVTSLTSAAASVAQQIAAAELKIRGLLRRDQPSEALQTLLDLEKQGLRSQKLGMLRMASLLSLFELLTRLDSAELRQKTADEFRSLNRRLIPASKGVWRDCCDRIGLRLSHVEKFGVEAATAIESVGELLAAGDFAAARNALLSMRPKFERSSPEIAATILMQAGDLAVRMSDWQAAETDLTAAVELFQTTNNREQSAASDLLRIYAIGRRWDAAVTQADENHSTLEATYQEALDQHLAKFAESPTATKAHEWRAMLNRATDPVAAAEELVSLIDGTGEDEPMLLVQSGEILLEAIFDSTSTASAPASQAHADRSTAIIAEWQQHVDEVLASPADTVISGASAPPAGWIRPVLQIQKLLFSLQPRWSAVDDWKKLATDATSRLQELAAFDRARDPQSHISDAMADGHAILVLAACRQLLGFDAMQESRALLLRQSGNKRRQLANILIRQASETDDPIPGDPQLGFFALDLLGDTQFKLRSIDQQLEHLPLLLAASRVADNFQQFDAILKELTAKQLSDAQLESTSVILQRRSAMKVSTATSSESEKAFWGSVLKRSKSGEEQWLEASLQLVTIAIREGKFRDAARMLNVIDALHPEWGTPQRKARAAALKAELESSP